MPNYRKDRTLVYYRLPEIFHSFEFQGDTVHVYRTYNDISDPKPRSFFYSLSSFEPNSGPTPFAFDIRTLPNPKFLDEREASDAKRIIEEAVHAHFPLFPNFEELAALCRTIDQSARRQLPKH